jgi:hypothetical protein
LLGTAAHAQDTPARPLPAPAADSSRVELPPPASRAFWYSPAADGSLLREDRFEHASLAASLVVAGGSAGLDDAPTAGGVLALGLWKEWMDHKRGGQASRLDLVADVVGIGLGLLVLRAVR